MQIPPCALVQVSYQLSVVSHQFSENVVAMQNFRDLEVWAKAHALVLDVYRTTTRFPREELYGFTSQLRRSAVSVSSNIAEGCGRGRADFARFLRIAMGSASELEYQLLLAAELDFLGHDDARAFQERSQEVKRMLAALISKLTADD